MKVDLLEVLGIRRAEGVHPPGRKLAAEETIEQTVRHSPLTATLAPSRRSSARGPRSSFRRFPDEAPLTSRTSPRCPMIPVNNLV